MQEEDFNKIPRLVYSKKDDIVYIVLNREYYDVTDSFDIIESWRNE